MHGYAMVLEGDERSGYSAYSPDLPGVVAAGPTRAETESLMLDAMTHHVTLLHDLGEPIPHPATSSPASG